VKTFLILSALAMMATASAQDAITVDADGVRFFDGDEVHAFSNDGDFSTDPTTEVPTESVVASYVAAQALRPIYYAGEPASDRWYGRGTSTVVYDNPRQQSEAGLMQNGVFVAPADGDGLYQIGASYLMLDLKRGRIAEIKLSRLNPDGSTDYVFMFNKENAYREDWHDPNPSATCVVPLRAGDRLAVQVYHNDNGSNKIRAWGTRLTIARVGPLWDGYAP